MNKGIRNFFKALPATYELINTILTFGLDAIWRRRAVRWAARGKNGNRVWLDICTGTGQMARLAGKISSRESLIVGADFSHPMLVEAKRKSNGAPILFSGADALHLPFGNQTFDCVTIGFATRNLNSIDGQLPQAFRDFHRVLKPGGCFVNIETSQPKFKFIRFFFHLYVKLTVKPVGKIISGSSPSYAYLANSIRLFHDADKLKEILLDSGFSTVEYKRLLFGAVAIHKAVK